MKLALKLSMLAAALGTQQPRNLGEGLFNGEFEVRDGELNLHSIIDQEEEYEGDTAEDGVEDEVYHRGSNGRQGYYVHRQEHGHKWLHNQDLWGSSLLQTGSKTNLLKKAKKQPAVFNEDYEMNLHQVVDNEEHELADDAQEGVEDEVYHKGSGSHNGYYVHRQENGHKWLHNQDLWGSSLLQKGKKGMK